MTKKRATSTLEPPKPQAKRTNPIIPNFPHPVKNNELQWLKERSGKQDQDMVQVVKSRYPKYDKMLHSKCKRSEEYGVQLLPDAMRALYEHLAPDLLKKPRMPNRQKPNRIQARLADGLYEQLRRHLECTGETAQGFLEELVAQFFKTSK